MGKECQREPVVAADPDEVKLGVADALLGGLGVQVGQLTALQIAPGVLDRVEFRRIRRPKARQDRGRAVESSFEVHHAARPLHCSADVSDTPPSDVWPTVHR